MAAIFDLEYKKFNPSGLPMQSLLGVDIYRGDVNKWSIVHKFGRNDSVTTSITPVSIGGNYRTPTTATALEVVSSNVNDTAAGTGGQEITVVGLDSSWNEVTQTVELNGTTAVALPTNLTRLYRAYISRSGTYANQTAGSHAGTITIRESGAGQEWAEIEITGTFGKGQTQIGAYTVPAGYTAYLLSKHMSVDANQSAIVYFYQRTNIDDTTTPYTGVMRLVEQQDGVSGDITVKPITPIREFPEKTDIGFMAQTTAGTASVSVDFEILLVEN